MIQVESIVAQCLEHASHPVLYVLGAIITGIEHTQARRVGNEEERDPEGLRALRREMKMKLTEGLSARASHDQVFAGFFKIIILKWSL